MEKYLITATTVKGYLEEQKELIRCEIYSSSEEKANKILDLLKANYSEDYPREYTIKRIE